MRRVASESEPGPWRIEKGLGRLCTTPCVTLPAACTSQLAHGRVHSIDRHAGTALRAGCGEAWHAGGAFEGCCAC